MMKIVDSLRFSFSTLDGIRGTLVELYLKCFMFSFNYQNLNLILYYP